MELEAVLAGHPQVADAAVVPRPDERTGEIRAVREIPRTPSGKILRRLLVEADRAELAGAGQPSRRLRTGH